MTNNIEKILHKKREELEQKLADAKNVVAKIKLDIESLDKAILICSPDYKIEVAGTKKRVQIFKPREFKNLLIPFLKSHNDFVDVKAIVEYFKKEKDIVYSSELTEKDFIAKIVKNLYYYFERKVLMVEEEGLGVLSRWRLRSSLEQRNMI